MDVRAKSLRISLIVTATAVVLFATRADSSDRGSRACRGRCASQFHSGQFMINSGVISGACGTVVGPCAEFEIAGMDSSSRAFQTHAPFASNSTVSMGERRHAAFAMAPTDIVPVDSDGFPLLGGRGVATKYGPAVRLEVDCPGDALLTVNGEATTQHGRHRFIDLPMPSGVNDAGRALSLEYTVEGFVKRGNEWMTFHPDTGKLISMKRFGDAGLVPRTYQLPRDQAKLHQPLVFRNDNRPKPDLPELPAGPVIAQAVPAAVVVTATATVAATPVTVSFATVDDTEILRDKNDAFKKGALKTSPIVPVTIRYSTADGSVAGFARAAPKVATLGLSFQGDLGALPKGTTDSPTVTLNVFVDATLDDKGNLSGKKTPKVSADATVARKPKFDRFWTSSLELVTAESGKDATFWDALHAQITNSLAQLDGATYLVVQVTLDFATADKKKTPVSNYIILWIAK